MSELLGMRRSWFVDWLTNRLSNRMRKAVKKAQLTQQPKDWDKARWWAERIRWVRFGSEKVRTQKARQTVYTQIAVQGG